MDYPVGEELAQMLLAEWDDEIQTLPANRSHQTFTIVVRGGRRTGVRSILSPNPRSASSNSPEKIESRSWIRNRYGWSLGPPSRNCCRVHSAVGCCNVAVQNPAAADLHDQQHVQDLEASRDRDQKVASDDRLSVIVNKGPPMLRRSSPWTLAAGLLRPVGTYGSW